ncbi:MAG: hypothetical protein DKM50_12270 [Candidatus Margulisiibacteriota bacterium]|nr:MAG: hypothetical protein A2X43_01065 [Candidatus Margulisbacteria bacterium GWD2_39_127]OGI02416.1 MAG: hypothetical protein A2X42_09715 [Candidatus Margulisbacteria bacterium GWF2_38_17]OGI08549.1 MAG: hypothetical protein A2X41_07500 [Candidatus Margulisbacteria bacterium GWE2_39_32]PZM78201.1 MAG: hypothetical protein DKM50_12270 [Candidatus Margulisiibacteriota bacterium]HAR63462.1 hypothetical protein [Candidatus Margulisiibacteriota bacterium]
MHPIQFLIENLMLPLLKLFYSVSHSYAFAIMILTLVVKIIFYPLNKKQFISMKKMSELQPMFKKIQAKFKDEPQKMQAEMMKLYKTNGVNPLSGCLPLLIQLPFLIALFYTLTSPAFQNMLAVSSANATFLWISNLVKPDHFYILPALLGISTWLSQKTMTVDPQQAKMFMFMPFLMVIISLNFPAGVLIYWNLSQILTIAQQVYMNKKYEKTKIA